MIFLGTTFCGMKHTIDVTATNVSNIKSIILSGGQFGNLLITEDTAFAYSTEINSEWDYNTVMYAPFRNDLYAGNINYSVQQVSCVRIKRRRTGTHQWITIDEVPINSVEDFRFDRFERYARACEYDFCLVPVVNGIEGNMNINSIKSEFDGIYIVDKSDAFSTVLDVSLPSVDRIKPTSVVQTLGSKHPFVISNGSINYDQGNISALFLEQDINGEWKTTQNVDYRKRITDFLTNGNPKIMKLGDGRCWMIKVIDNVINNEDGHPDKIAISFSWVQIGDDESTNDLYYNNFIDVNVEGV